LYSGEYFDSIQFVACSMNGVRKKLDRHLTHLLSVDSL
jgi:hypothetical protein